MRCLTFARASISRGITDDSSLLGLQVFQKYGIKFAPHL